MVNIEINGKQIRAREGAMVIEAADEAGVRIPRFCYHKKLSVAANCRMCLVEVEKAPKPMPACATPVTEGMKIFTRSKKALAAQKAVMEFLLINHPLDCPICDQGGECELQEMAMGYGQDVSRFSEKKRVIKEKNIGPLIATDMTRCIHCTRCVRFGQELAGIRELGATGRGEHMEIGTFIEKSVDSELSGNVIDLCPVGALTSKPYRYTARPWELVNHDSIAPHDCLGSNIIVQTRRNTVMRVLPKENEKINEVWLSDRDRYSYLSVHSSQRLTAPHIKVNGEWEEVDWNTALEFTRKILRDSLALDNNELGTLVSPSSTVEELYLAQKLTRGLGSKNIDHRLRQLDFAGQDEAPPFPAVSSDLETIEKSDVILLIGTNLRKEQPLINLRVRKAVLNGGKVFVINTLNYQFNYPIAGVLLGSTNKIVRDLVGVSKALSAEMGVAVSPGMSSAYANIEVSDAQQDVAKCLAAAKNPVIIIGSIADTSDRYSDMHASASVIAHLCRTKLSHVTSAGNCAGAWMSGAVPHRGVAGKAVEPGLNSREMLENPRKAYLLVGVEPDLDMADPMLAISALQAANAVVSLSVFDSPAIRDVADVLLPISPFTENAGTYINALANWQSFTPALTALGESRPAWKVLRVLGNIFELPGFDYVSPEQIAAEVLQHNESAGQETEPGSYTISHVTPSSGLTRVAEIPCHSVDGYTRRSVPLQNTVDAVEPSVYLNSVTAHKYELFDGNSTSITQGRNQIVLPVSIDERVPDDVVMIPGALPETIGLGAAFGNVVLSRSS